MFKIFAQLFPLPLSGLHQTAGHVDRKDIVADCDAKPIQLMKKAGGIIICVTNVSELCMWWESNNRVYGRSNNPYDTHRIVGGSSGGEVSLVAVENLADISDPKFYQMSKYIKFNIPCVYSGFNDRKCKFGKIIFPINFFKLNWKN